MNGFIVSGYDVLMVIWGIVFIVGAGGFIYAMNRLFQSEEKHQTGAPNLVAPASHAGAHPVHPAV